MRTEEDYLAFVAGQWSSLYRLAYLLCASPTEAESLLREALVGAYARWDLDAGDPEALVRRLMATSLWPRRRRFPRRRHRRHAAAPTGPTPSPRLPAQLTLWPLVCALPAEQRIVLVLRHHEGLAEAEMADLLGRPRDEVAAALDGAAAALHRAAWAATGHQGPVIGR